MTLGIFDLSNHLTCHRRRRNHTKLKDDPFLHQKEDLPLGENENRTDEEMALFHDFLNEHGDQLKQRLNTLTDVLVELRASGRI